MSAKKTILVVDFLIERIIFFIEMFGHHNLDIIENSIDAITYLKENKYDIIFLGGQLLEDDNCIIVAQFLADNKEKYKDSEIIVHSWDVITTDKILSLLPKAKYLPFNEKSFIYLFQ